MQTSRSSSCCWLAAAASTWCTCAVYCQKSVCSCSPVWDILWHRGGGGWRGRAKTRCIGVDTYSYPQIMDLNFDHFADSSLGRRFLCDGWAVNPVLILEDCLFFLFIPHCLEITTLSFSTRLIELRWSRNPYCIHAASVSKRNIMFSCPVKLHKCNDLAHI